MPDVEVRVSRLEQVLEEFITATRESSLRAELETAALREDLHNAYLRTEELIRQSQQRTDEKITASRLGTDELIRQSQQRNDELLAESKKELKQSRAEWKEELKQFKAEMKENIRQMNKKWGGMANKLGTVVEDLVHPSLPRIIKHKFGLTLQDFSIRRKRTLSRDKVKEFDCVGVSEKYVFLNSTKSTLRNKDAEDFLEDIKDFWEFCPEYRDKPLIGILASLYADDSVVKYMERRGFMVLCVGDSLMDVKNTKGFKPTEFHYPLNS